MTPEQIREVADFIGPNTAERDQAQRLLREYADLIEEGVLVYRMGGLSEAWYPCQEGDEPDAMLIPLPKEKG